MKMKLSVHIFVLVCAVTYVQCTTLPGTTSPIPVSTTTIKSTMHPPKDTTTKPPVASINPLTKASTTQPPKDTTTKPPAATINPLTKTPKPSPAKSPTPTSNGSVSPMNASTDNGLGNGSHQLVKPLGPLVFSTIVVLIYFL